MKVICSETPMGCLHEECVHYNAHDLGACCCPAPCEYSSNAKCIRCEDAAPSETITVSARELEVEPEKANKPCLSILFEFPRAMGGLARILLHGRKKYGGVKAGRALPSTSAGPCYESMLRHLLAIKSGEQVDSDSGELHVICLLANAFLAADKYPEGPKKDG